MLIFQEPHLFIWRKQMGEDKVRHLWMPLIPRGCLFDFWSSSVLQTFRPRVWAWLCDAPTPPCQPQFNTKRWGAPLSLTRFSQFSAQPWCDNHESTLCAYSKAWWSAPHHRRPCAEQKAAASIDGKWQQCLSPLTSVAGMLHEEGRGETITTEHEIPFQCNWYLVSLKLNSTFGYACVHQSTVFNNSLAWFHLTSAMVPPGSAFAFASPVQLAFNHFLLVLRCNHHSSLSYLVWSHSLHHLTSPPTRTPAALSWTWSLSGIAFKTLVL